MRIARVVAEGKIHEAQLVDELLVAGSRRFAQSEVQWLAPIKPRNIIGLALNYGGHAAELGLEEPPEPALFFKPTSAVVGNQAPVRYPIGGTHCHYEAEVAVVIGRECRRVSPQNALDYVLGYTVANDFTCRDFIRNTFRPPVRAKGFDSFCPLGPFLVTPDEVGDPGHLSIATLVNGEVRQKGNTEHLLHSIPEIIAYLSDFMTLGYGDVILTGTPDGISPVFPGDVMECRVEKIGSLTNPVVQEVLE